MASSEEDKKDLRESLKVLDKLEARVEPLEEHRAQTAVSGGPVLSVVIGCKALESLGIRVIPGVNSPGGTTAGGTTAGGTTAGGTTAAGCPALRLHV